MIVKIMEVNVKRLIDMDENLFNGRELIYYENLIFSCLSTWRAVV